MTSGHPYCQRCTGDTRKANLTDGLCNILKSQYDGLPVRCVGPWANKKIYFLSRYIDIFVKGMKNKWDWLNYFEVCSGPGVCIDNKAGIEIDGTALSSLAVLRTKTVGRVVYIDLNEVVLDTLKKRVKSRMRSMCLNNDELELNLMKYRYVNEDYGNSTLADKLISQVDYQNGSVLNLVFIDPTNASVPFSLIKDLQRRLRLDLIINVAIGTDVNRNLAQAILDEGTSKSRKKYAAFLGSDTFFCDPVNIQMAYDDRCIDLKMSFIEFYKKQLRSIGLQFIDHEPVENFYYLLYASSDKRGLEFWKKSHEVPQDGQYSLKF